MTANDDRTPERTELEPGDTLYDSERGEEYAVIVDIDGAGVTMRHGDTENFIPHALFAPWNDAGLVVGKPEACEQRETERLPEVSRA
jgi:hypothetical protein